ncbi:MAG: serine hydrolase domain-containing protein [Ktedonobacteraceae bacterium]
MKPTVSREYWPTTDWKEATPQEMGMNPSLLTEMHETIEADIPTLHSLLIVRYGYLLFERYYQGCTRYDEYYLASASKSVISALIGIALQEGYIKHLDQTLSEVFSEYIVPETEPRKKNITIRALLTMTSGLVAAGSDAELLDESKHLVPSVLALPMLPQPERVFQYTNSGPHLLLYLIAHITHTSIFAFAQTRLFQPLGIYPHEQWEITPQGWYPDVAPRSRLLLEARDMAKFGYLYLNQGFWDGVQVVPAAYVASSTRKHSEGGPPIGTSYGYLWWITQHGKYRAFFASGFGGQLIYVIPALDLIITTTASMADSFNEHEQWEKIQQLIPRFVLPAIIEN